MEGQPISKRLNRDLMAIIEEGPKNGIFVKVVNGDPRVLRMMLIGPKGPYENCLFFFDITFPTVYPINSPQVLFQCPYSIRCHPNLYKGGKVCLSILGTWSGPPWTPMMTLNTIAQTILSILDDEPLRNEPGYVNSPADKIKPYAIYVNFVCLKESVDLYRQCMTGTLPEKFRDFHDQIMGILIERKDRINAQIAEIIATHPDDTVIGSDCYRNSSYHGKKYFIEPL